MAKILIVDDETAIRKALERYLKDLGYDVVSAGDGLEAAHLLEREQVDLALVDLVMPRMSGIDFIKCIRRAQPDAVSIVLTGFGTITSAVEAIKAGAYHYLTKPFELDDISSLIATALEHRQFKEENRILKKQVQDRYKSGNIVGASDGMAAVFDLVDKVAETDSTVLITGESGTGKELVARAIHYNSKRKDKPLVTVNCAAIPEELLESELFGHIKGAFTGAVATHQGRFDAADRGTIFLDEIGDMTLKLQVKVLRILQEQRFEPVGSTATKQVDVRIIAATNHNLDTAVKEGKFREDLYYRLNVIPIHVPPLRERAGDIPLLVAHFVKKCAASSGRPPMEITPQAMKALMRYGWPGNVRELENFVERASILKKGGVIDETDLPPVVSGREEGGRPPRAGLAEGCLPEGGISLKETVAGFETGLILQALQRTSGNKNRAAKILGLNRTTLVEKIKKLGITVER